MAFFSSLPDDAGVRHVLSLNPRASRAWTEVHTAALRNDGALASRDKELIAAYVSDLNACQYAMAFMPKQRERSVSSRV